MRVILDTNVLLAALISPHSAPETIFRAWMERRFELVTCGVQLDELRRVSRYPKMKAILPAHRVGALINNLQNALVINNPPPLPQGVVLDDANDEFLLAMALASEANYLVTGDKRAGLLQRKNIGRTRIVTPSGFCKEAI
jgi:putative PIN family toxin of toxin-antitoxin system